MISNLLYCIFLILFFSALLVFCSIGLFKSFKKRKCISFIIFLVLIIVIISMVYFIVNITINLGHFVPPNLVTQGVRHGIPVVFSYVQ